MTHNTTVPKTLNPPSPENKNENPYDGDNAAKIFGSCAIYYLIIRKIYILYNIFLFYIKRKYIIIKITSMRPKTARQINHKIIMGPKDFPIFEVPNC